MKYVKPLRLKILMIMFFVTGGVGILMGLYAAPPNSSLMITFLGVINLVLGAFFAWVFLTQEPELNEKRKKKSDQH